VGGRSSHLGKEHCEKTQEWLGASVGMAITEVAAKLKATFNIKIGRSALFIDNDVFGRV